MAMQTLYLCLLLVAAWNRDVARAQNTTSSDPKEFLTPELFLFVSDWNPSSCSAFNTPCLQNPLEAFTVYGLMGWNNVSGRIDSCPHSVPIANIIPEVPEDATGQLQCTFKDSTNPVGPSSYEVWNDLWAKAGACTGLNITDYFDKLNEFYDKYNLNVVMGQIGDGPPVVFTADFLNQMSKRLGKRVALDCVENMLQNVVICMEKTPPYNQVDCPFDSVRPDGSACPAQLRLPVETATLPAVKVPESCVSYVKPYYLQTPESSSNTGAMVGAIVGGVVGAILIALAVFFVLGYRKRRRNAAIAAATANGKDIEKGADFMVSAVPSLQSSKSASLEQSNYTDSYFTAVNTVGRRSIGPNGEELIFADQQPDPLKDYITNTVLGSNQSKSSKSASRGPLEAWELRFSDITLGRPIGEGSWGRVYKGNYHQTEVAVKILVNKEVEEDASDEEGCSYLVGPSSELMKRLQVEASIMTQLQNPYIVQFMGITKFPAAVVTEYCARGSLHNVLRNALKSPEKAALLTWERRISMAADCVRGMLYLHSRNPPIVHRDLKTPNLLVTTHWQVKVSDFNLSKVMQEAVSKMSSLHATNPRWLPPEVLQDKPANLASDVFSFGVVLWELLTWEFPWKHTSQFLIVHEVLAGQRLPIPPPNELPGPNSDSWPQLDRYIALINRCWAQKPEDRPTFDEIMVELQAIDPVATQSTVE